MLLLALLMTVTAEDQSKADAAQKLLESRCYQCHGENGSAEGGFDYVLDVSKMVERKKLKPNAPDDSRILELVKSQEMPAEGEPLTADEIAVLETWIKAGAPPFDSPLAGRRDPITDVEVYQAMRKYLSDLHPAAAKFQRFILLLPQYNDNQHVSDAELRLYRAGVAKLLNSLSWKRRAVMPQVIDAHGAVLAIDLRDLDWDLRNHWTRLVAARPRAGKRDFHPGYPFGLLHDRYPEDDQLNRAAEQVYELTGTQLPAVRADWFLATAARPPLYHELLNLPNHARDLERLLKVDVPADFLRDRVVRVGLTTSGVSASANRLVDLHESAYGIYMKSRDFRTNDDRGNIVRFPNGPLNLFADGKHPFADTAFVHDGGEMIASLPNGLHLYMLVDGKDERIDEGPPDVVRDKREFAGRGPFIVNGISCMGCHEQGVIRDNMTDRIRLSESLQGAARDKMRRTYPEQAQIDRRLEEAQQEYLAALDRIAGPYLKVDRDAEKSIDKFPEPITTLATPFLQGNLTPEQAALELGVTVADLAAAIKNNPQLSDFGLGPLANGVAIKRSVWESVRGGTSVFQEVAAEMRRGAPYRISSDE